MRDLLKEYYGLDIEYGREYQNGLIFFVNGDYFYLCKSYLSNEEVEKSFQLSLLLNSKGILLHDFVFNNDNKLLSKDYVLLKLNYLISDIDINDLKKTNIIVDFEMKDNFYKLWLDKIDYYEENLFTGDGNNYISYSFDYFVGISEVLLNLYKNNDTYSEQKYIVHRTFYSLSTIDYYNPLNIVVGDRSKDYSSYIRLTNNWNLLYQLLEVVEYKERVNLFIRLSFPYNFFNCINRIFYDNVDNKEMLSIIEDIDKYENYLSTLEKIMGVKVFYWIKKDN